MEPAVLRACYSLCLKDLLRLSVCFDAAHFTFVPSLLPPRQSSILRSIWPAGQKLITGDEVFCTAGY